MSRRVFSRKVKPLIYASTFAAVGGTAYLAYSPRNSLAPQTPNLVLARNKDGSIIPPKFPHIKSREEQLADLRRIGGRRKSSKTSTSEEIYDLLVIGGGATGTGIALDAASRGLKVALVERDDFSSGTSSKSTKLVHGGVRYLEKAVWNLDYSQYQLVVEALRERKNFLYAAPHLSSWIPIMLPLQKWWQVPYFWAGTKCYDLLAGREANPNSYYLSKSKALDAFPMLKKDLIGALVYYDGQQDDSRMNVSLALTAALYGATTVNHLEVTKLEKDETGKLCGAHVRDLVSSHDGDSAQSNEFFVRSKGIINATGPFADAINQMDEPRKRDIVAPSLGVHVVLPGHFSPPRMGLLDPSTSDGRVLFLLPWQGNTIAGTTDSPCSISKNPVPAERDIEWILNATRKYLSSDLNLQRDDVLAAWSGIRPLVRDPEAKNTESLVRNHLVTVSKSGLLTCAGGKWTTYRQMAEDAVDKAIEVFDLQPGRFTSTTDVSGLNSSVEISILNGSCQTQKLRLIGSHGYTPTLHINLIQEFNLEADIAQHLAQSYGDRAWEVASLISAPTDTTSRTRRLSPQYPFIEAEVRYAAQREYAQTAVDVLARRTRLSFLDAKAALESLPKVIDLMGEELKWSEARKELEWSETVGFLASMGLPVGLLGVTREEVVGHRLGKPFKSRIPNKEATNEVEEAKQPNTAEFPLAAPAA